VQLSLVSFTVDASWSQSCAKILVRPQYLLDLPTFDSFCVLLTHFLYGLIIFGPSRGDGHSTGLIRCQRYPVQVSLASFTGDASWSQTCAKVLVRLQYLLDLPTFVYFWLTFGLSRGDRYCTGLVRSQPCRIQASSVSFTVDAPWSQVCIALLLTLQYLFNLPTFVYFWPHFVYFWLIFGLSKADCYSTGWIRSHLDAI